MINVCNHCVFRLLTKVRIKDPFHLVAMCCFGQDFTQSSMTKRLFHHGTTSTSRPYLNSPVVDTSSRQTASYGMKTVDTTYTFSNLHVAPKQQVSLRSIKHTTNILATTKNYKYEHEHGGKWVENLVKMYGFNLSFQAQEHLNTSQC